MYTPLVGVVSGVGGWVDQGISCIDWSNLLAGGG